MPGYRDIQYARTLPSAFYRSREVFEGLRDEVFRQSWQFLGTESDFRTANAVPVHLLPSFIDEPLLITVDKSGVVRCLSNVCTHRGNIIAEQPGNAQILRCRYHGRCFGLDGKFRSMPGFEGVEDFPSHMDDLTSLDIGMLGPMYFASLGKGRSWEAQFAEMEREMSWFAMDGLTYRADVSRDYFIHAHWALYVDNYLEGFHVPFVHPGLNDALDVEGYAIRCFDGGALQVGVAADNETECIEIPEGNSFSGQQIYAIYWWLFPNLMFNFYPWGISVNVVEPIAVDKTRVRFLTFARDGEPDPDVDSIHQTEIEDEEVVEGVQRGLKSSYYVSGRYSAKHEKAVFHFHNMLREYV